MVCHRSFLATRRAVIGRHIYRFFFFKEFKKKKLFIKTAVVAAAKGWTITVRQPCVNAGVS